MFRISSLLVITCLLCSFTSSNSSLSADFYVKGEIDGNGYIHVKLPWNGEYWPRFTLGIEADKSPTTYNNHSVVSAKLSSDQVWDGGMYGEIEYVQSTSVYFSSPKRGTKGYTKRIIGPFPPEFRGDTLVVDVEVVWDLGKFEEKKDYSLKFIVE